jgi:hypothetical protein
MKENNKDFEKIKIQNFEKKQRKKERKGLVFEWFIGG